MGANDREIEAKFYLRDLPGMEARLRDMGAELAEERVFEENLRFDTPRKSLTRDKRVLRLRRDRRAWLTYKGPLPDDDPEGASARREIEVNVSDFGATRRILEALGYHLSFTYEKYRTTYHLDGLIVALDELPYGPFMEIEGPDSESVKAGAARLGLDWSARCMESYYGLWERLRKGRWLASKNLTFDELAGERISAERLGVRPADGGQPYSAARIS